MSIMIIPMKVSLISPCYEKIKHFEKFIYSYIGINKEIFNFNHNQIKYLDEYINNSQNNTYWAFDENQNLVGVIRFRKNFSLYWGNVGIDISPEFQDMGYGKVILKNLIRIISNETNELIFTIKKDNIKSQKIVLGLNGYFSQEIYHEHLK